MDSSIRRPAQPATGSIRSGLKKSRRFDSMINGFSADCKGEQMPRLCSERTTHVKTSFPSMPRQIDSRLRSMFSVMFNRSTMVTNRPSGLVKQSSAAKVTGKNRGGWQLMVFLQKSATEDDTISYGVGRPSTGVDVGSETAEICQ